MADLTELIAEQFADLNQPGSPGATVAVVREGEIAYSVSAGQASLEHSIPNQRDTVFYIASTSKQFVGAPIAILEAEGKLSLDDDIRVYLPEMHTFGEPIRIYHLLHHTSGIRDKYALAPIGGLPEESYSTDSGSLRLLAAQRTLNFPPGTQSTYSNSGYFLLAQIVERVTGQPLREFTHERIFGPAGMDNTVFRDDPGLVIPKKASGYARRAAGGWRLAEYTWAALGPGGVFTTVDDLARWDRALDGGVLEPADLHERILRKRPLVDGKPNNYAHGLMVDKHRGLRTIHHAGGVSGYSAEFLRFPDQRLTVICLANTSAAGSSMRARRVAEIFLEKHMEPAAAKVEASEGISGVSREAFAGAYASEDQSAFAEITIDGEQVVLRSGTLTMPLEVIDAKRLRSPAGFDMVFDDEGFATEASDAAGAARKYKRLDVALPSGEDAHNIVGRYRSEELGRDIVISVDAADLAIARDGEKAAVARRVGRDLLAWPVESGGEMPVAIVRDENGRAVALKLGVDRRAVGVMFARIGRGGG